ncbi:Flp pilus assembly protein CpaB [Tautonia plasticadhaerens]|uniref:SAF domain protein n=1 Tax=Tautonia plasticadhaerens TaxID=2527974 RepID=A0A518H529_9BACT|nr:Flp pilus assembly protein CpaB [Tautonia plasticadhaerens]QDV35954.1 SAF domain protein [Tautonia plasticadhaerens]
MNGKALMLLVMAGACGLAAMFGVRTLLNRKQTSKVPMSAVLVAIQEIKVEQAVTPEMISTKEMPAEMVPPGALTDPKQALNRWAMIRILPGDVILDGKLAQKGTPTGMIARITPGMRAFAIRVDEQSGVSGFILPDYRVDVLQPWPDQPGRADIVLENVRVLASGTVFERLEERAIEATTVTLEVTPEQVRVLASAMQRGSLTLSLRGLNDELLAEAPEPEPVAPPEPTPAVASAPDPEPEPEPEPVVTIVDDPPPAPSPVPIVVEPEPPRRLTVFAGRTPPRFMLIGPAGGDPLASPDPADEPEIRRPFFLDGLGDPPTAALSSPPPG